MDCSPNQLKDKLKLFSLNYFNNFCAATIYIHILVSNQCYISYISYYKLVSIAHVILFKSLPRRQLQLRITKMHNKENVTKSLKDGDFLRLFLKGLSLENM